MILSMSRPKACSLATDEHLIVRIRSGGLIKRRVTGIENEEDDTHRKQVNLLSHVRLVLVDFRSHVTHGTYQCPQLSSPLITPCMLGEAHVNYF